MRFLIFRTSAAPSGYAWSVEDLDWPTEPPVPHAQFVDYEHRFDSGPNAGVARAKGWAVDIDTVQGLVDLMDTPAPRARLWEGEIILRRFGGHLAIELYDGYRE